MRRRQRSTLFPYTTLFRSGRPGAGSGQAAETPLLPGRAVAEEHSRITFSRNRPSEQARLVKAEGLGERELLVDVTSGEHDGQQVRLRKARVRPNGEQNG